MYRPDMIDLYEEVTGDRLSPPTADDIPRRVKPALFNAVEEGELVVLRLPLFGAWARMEEEGIHGQTTARIHEIPALPSRARQVRPAREKETTWIGIKVTDQSGKPLPDRRYRLTMTNGSTEEGRTDTDGTARVDDINPGLCKLELLDVDNGKAVLSNAARPLNRLERNQLPDGGKSWIAIRLVDVSGAPVAGRGYELIERDGTVHRGTVSEEGVARVDGITVGLCRIRLVDLNEAEVRRTG
jgi:hypothetical protein